MSRRFACLALASALLLACRADAAEGTAAPAAPILPSITVAEIAPTRLVQRVRASGVIAPVEEVLVQPQIEGQAVESIAAEVGDWVEKGATLARLSDASLRLQRSQLEASRASAEAAIAQSEAQIAEFEALRDEALRERERAEKLFSQGVASTATADTARANAATALARFTAAGQALNAAAAQLRLVEVQIADVELNLGRTAISAPVAGRVTARAARIGSIASGGGQPLFAIMRDGALELRAEVAEQDLLALAPGQPTALTVAGGGAPIPGEIRLVEPTVDPDTRLGRVRIGVDDPDAVRAGMFAEAEIRVREVEALAAPVSAVRSAEGRDTVLRVRDGVVETASIVPGIRDGGLVEVVEGLAAGDLVVAKAGAFVRDGDRINPTPVGEARR